MQRFDVRDCFAETHEGTANLHEFSKLSILQAFKNLCCKSHIMGGSARAHEAAIRNTKVDKKVDIISDNLINI